MSDLFNCFADKMEAAGSKVTAVLRLQGSLNNDVKNLSVANQRSPELKILERLHFLFNFFLQVSSCPSRRLAPSLLQDCMLELVSRLLEDQTFFISTDPLNGTWSWSPSDIHQNDHFHRESKHLPRLAVFCGPNPSCY